MEYKLPEKRLIYYDKNREFNLVRVHDGNGNFYGFNCPPDITLKVKDVLKRGELVSFKLKGEVTKKMDSSADQFFRYYNLIIPLEFKDAHMTREEFNELLAERKKRAPVPGKETAYPPFINLKSATAKLNKQDEEEIPAIIPTEKSPYGKSVGRFKNELVYRPDPARPPFIIAEKNCSVCQRTIKGKIPISLDKRGDFSRPQTFVSFEKARTAEKGSHLWICENCNTDLPSREKQTQEGISSFLKPATYNETQPAAPAAKVSGKSEIIKGGSWFKFEKRDGKFFYKGREIMERENGGAKYFRTTLPCEECGGDILLEASVSYKDGLPCLVSANRPVVRGSAAPVRPKAQRWKHTRCPQGKTETPAPVEVEAGNSKTETPVPPVPPPPAAAAVSGVQPPPLTQNTTALTLAAKKLEEMAMDSEGVEDKALRGAAWMFCRYVALSGGTP